MAGATANRRLSPSFAFAGLFMAGGLSVNFIHSGQR